MMSNDRGMGHLYPVCLARFQWGHGLLWITNKMPFLLISQARPINSAVPQCCEYRNSTILILH